MAYELLRRNMQPQVYRDNALARRRLQQVVANQQAKEQLNKDSNDNKWTKRGRLLQAIGATLQDVSTSLRGGQGSALSDFMERQQAYNEQLFEKGKSVSLDEAIKQTQEGKKEGVDIEYERTSYGYRPSSISYEDTDKDIGYKGVSKWEMTNAKGELYQRFLKDKFPEASKGGKPESWWSYAGPMTSKEEVVRREFMGDPVHEDPVDTLETLGFSMDDMAKWGAENAPELSRVAFPGKGLDKSNLEIGEIYQGDDGTEREYLGNDKWSDPIGAR